MDKKVSITYSCTEETELRRLVYLCKQVAKGFYTDHQFLVLPYVVEEHKAASVYLPEFPYTTISDFWKRIQDVDENNIESIPADILTFLRTNLKDTDSLEKEITTFREKWEQQRSKIIDFLAVLFPLELAKIQTINVYLTSFGTKMSYGNLPSEKGAWWCYVRKDCSIESFIEGLVSALVRSQQEHLQLSWEGIESIADFLLDRLVEQGLLTTIHPTMSGLATIDKEKLSASKSYLASLGLFIGKPYTIKNEHIYFHNKPVTPYLTKQQQLLLASLVKRENEVLSYDELGGEVWKNDDDFSLWALTKDMQRLRARLNSLGFDGGKVQLVKGKGYVLIN